MTQQDLDVFHTKVQSVVQLWASGLITDMEFVKAMVAAPRPADTDLYGLLDPNSGLRYKIQKGAINVHQC